MSALTGESRALLAVLVVASCGTGGSDDDDSANTNLPSAGVGPFRDLTSEEVKGIAPFVLEDSAALYREPAVLSDGAVTFLYAVAQADPARAGADVIVRTRSLDERTFYGASSSSAKPAVVLVPDQSWEGPALGGPSLVRFGGAILLYYAGAAGIGVARSSDGRSFQKVTGPVLALDPSAGSWETAPPRAPSVYALPDGSLRMLYAVGSAIGEASSADGVAWRRRAEAPVFTASRSAGDFDEVAVGDPCASTRTTAAGRLLVRVLYTGTNAAGATAIGFAGRFGDSGNFSRSSAPVYAVGKKEAAPALLDTGATSFLYVEEELQSGDMTWPAIAAAVAPDTTKLPQPGAFPTEP